jgi:TPR repeat protein
MSEIRDDSGGLDKKMEKVEKVIPAESENPQDWYGTLVGDQDNDGANIDDIAREKFNRAFDAAAAGSFREAFKIYSELAEAGIAVSQYYLGKMYLKGSGTLQDYCKAHMWFNLAASQDYKKAADQLETLTTRMTPEQLAEAQKMARDWVNSQA